MDMREGKVSEQEDGMRLDRWAKRHWPDVPHGLLQKSGRKGQLRVDGKRAAPDTRLEMGQGVTLRGASVQEKTDRPKLALDMTDAQRVALLHSILYEDEHLLAINKQPGLAVQGGSGQERHLDGMLGAFQGPFPERPKLVHRLDRDTSGVLLLARDARSAATLAKAFAEKEVQKVYWALVRGVPKKSRGVIDMPLEKSGEERERMVVSDEGQEAITHYRIIERVEEQFAWMELMPVTGRTHQLRAHMEALGHPIVGDGKYGLRHAGDAPWAKQLQLHARRLVMPAQGKIGPLDITAPIPKHMRQAFEFLGLPIDDHGVSLLEVGL